ncbi:MAG TPA: ATP-binding cassette domain-containing protein, partial [Erysipelothrix sp.]|nr:ATP-binding cassette domain-containing protein [Erysipelothrix sp.]
MKPIITFNQVSKTFDQAKQPIKALDHVSFSIHEQDIFGVIGMSGAGKSTLVRCINFLERPDQGQVIVNNKVLDQLNDTQLRQERQKIGMIFQHFNLLSQKTVLENVMLPLKIAGVDHSRAQTKALELLE